MSDGRFVTTDGCTLAYAERPKSLLPRTTLRIITSKTLDRAADFAEFKATLGEFLAECVATA